MKLWMVELVSNAERQMRYRNFWSENLKEKGYVNLGVEGTTTLKMQ
jgi:hypothetical protein